MAKYYDQLSNLTQKIPTQELQIPFKWQDAFSKGKSVIIDKFTE